MHVLAAEWPPQMDVPAAEYSVRPRCQNVNSIGIGIWLGRWLRLFVHPLISQMRHSFYARHGSDNQSLRPCQSFHTEKKVWIHRRIRSASIEATSSSMPHLLFSALELNTSIDVRLSKYTFSILWGRRELTLFGIAYLVSMEGQTSMGMHYTWITQFGSINYAGFSLQIWVGTSQINRKSSGIRMNLFFHRLQIFLPFFSCFCCLKRIAAVAARIRSWSQTHIGTHTTGELLLMAWMTKNSPSVI